MPVAVTMRGMLEPVILEDDFTDTLTSLNITAAKGMEFVGTRTRDGDNILLRVDHILSARDLGHDDD